MRKVLVIDDESALLDLTVSILEDEGYAAQAAPDGTAGLALAFEDPPDLILCDLQMQGLSGYQVLAILRRDPRTAVVPVIFMTGMGGDEAIRQGMNLGADDYLVKPVSTQLLLTTVRARIDRSHDVRQEAARRMTELRNELARSLLPHELLTPLTVVMGLASLLKDEGAIDASQVKEVAEGILLGALELEVTITKFLLCAEIQTSHPGAPLASVRGMAVLSEAARATASRAGREADLEIDVESFPSPMPTDHLKAMVHELVENALAFSKPGSAITIRGGRDGEAVLLSVSDQGRGMTAEQVAGLQCAPFLRRNREQPGLGLGLTIVRKLVELYGGGVSFETAAGRGTTARIRFAGPQVAHA